MTNIASSKQQFQANSYYYYIHAEIPTKKNKYEQKLP